MECSFEAVRHATRLLFTWMKIGFHENVECNHFRQCFPAAVSSGHVLTFLPLALGYLTHAPIA